LVDDIGRRRRFARPPHALELFRIELEQMHFRHVKLGNFGEAGADAKPGKQRPKRASRRPERSLRSFRRSNFSPWRIGLSVPDSCQRSNETASAFPRANLFLDALTSVPRICPGHIRGSPLQRLQPPMRAAERNYPWSNRVGGVIRNSLKYSASYSHQPVQTFLTNEGRICPDRERGPRGSMSRIGSWV